MHSEYTHRAVRHTQEPCINASHALLLCNVARNRARSVQVESGLVTMVVVVVFVIEESASSPCGCGVWSSGSGGVASLGDGVGEGDNDSGGVEQAEWVKLRREGPYACGCAWY